MTKEPLVVCDHWNEPHPKSPTCCVNPRPVEASAPAAPPDDHLTQLAVNLLKAIDFKGHWPVAVDRLIDVLSAAAPDAELRELRASLKAEVVGNNGMMFQRWTDDGIERIIQLARSAREKELEGK